MSPYENPEVDHSVNVSQRSSLAEFLSLSLWLALGTALVVGSLFLGARWLAPWVPFSWEVRLAQHVVPLVLTELDTDESSTGASPPSTPSESAPKPQTRPTPNPPTNAALAEQRRVWLQALADTLRPAMGMQAMPITVHWSGSKEPNAFATLGGHVVINQGFLDLVGSENAVAMVMAHEMAHVKHRDALVGLGGGMVVGLSMAALFGSGTLAGEMASGLSQLHFSRQQERAADDAALAALQAHYGHTADAENFFQRMLCEEMDGIAPEWLNSHPDTAERVRLIQAQRSAAPQTPTPVRPLPPFLQHKPPEACATS